MEKIALVAALAAIGALVVPFLIAARDNSPRIDGADSTVPAVVLPPGSPGVTGTSPAIGPGLRPTSVPVGGPEASATTAVVIPSVRQPVAGSVANEFDLDVMSGVGYDLDVAAGQAANTCISSAFQHPECRDLYRVTGDTSAAQLSGVNSEGKDDANAIHLVSANDPPTRCPTMATQSRGYVRLTALTAGSRMCLNTRQGRWVMLIVKAVPSGRDFPLSVHVLVLGS
jgi:hypothetical protein